MASDSYAHRCLFKNFKFTRGTIIIMDLISAHAPISTNLVLYGLFTLQELLIFKQSSGSVSLLKMIHHVDFSIFSSGGHFLRRSEIICAIRAIW